MLVSLCTVLGFCVVLVIGKENKERVASLIVLPPIVLGYDELYDEENLKKPTQKDPEKPKEIKTEATPVKSKTPLGFKRMNVPWDQLVAYDDPRGGEDAIIIPQQRLVLTRTKEGKIVVPDKEWTLPSKGRSSQVNNVVRMSELRENLLNGHKSDCKYYNRQGDNITINKDPSDRNETSGDVAEKITIGNTELKKDNESIEEEIGKTQPINENGNDGKEDHGNKHEDNKDRNNVNEDINKLLEIDSKINGEKVVAEKVMDSDVTSKNEYNENEETTIENDQINLLEKKTHISLPGNGVISDPLSGDILNFKGNFVLPHKLFDCPCAKNKS